MPTPTPDFKAKSWLEQYLAYRQQHPLAPLAGGELPEELMATLPSPFEGYQHPLYLCLQQSGMAFGFPVAYPFKDPSGAFGQLSVSSRAKFVLLDTMLYAVYLQEGAPSGEAYQRMVAQAGRLLRAYYRHLHQTAFQEQSNFVEDILFQRVQYKKRLMDFRRSGINTHLFWDLQGFLQYYEYASECEGEIPEAWFEELLQQKKMLKVLSFKIIAAAIHADWKIARAEQSLARQFNAASRLLSKSEKASVGNLFKWGVALEDIQIPQALNWEARRHLLDIALLAVYADREIDLQEDTFLRRLAFRLGLTAEDLLSSKASLGIFLFQYGERLHFRKAKSAGLQLAWQAITENMAKLGRAARMEAVETRDMAATFGKLLSHRLSPKADPSRLPSEEEIQAAMAQLKDLPRFLPFFSLFFIPVPGITELYILTAIGLEKLSRGKVSLLPSQLRKLNAEQEE